MQMQLLHIIFQAKLGLFCFKIFYSDLQKMASSVFKTFFIELIFQLFLSHFFSMTKCINNDSCFRPDCWIGFLSESNHNWNNIPFFVITLQVLHDIFKSWTCGIY